MKTFNWEEIPKVGLIELRCFHTQRNTNFNTTRYIMTSFFALPEDVEEARRDFEEKRKCVVEGGAWEPTEDAEWYFDDNKWRIDKKYIRLLD